VKLESVKNYVIRLKYKLKKPPPWMRHRVEFNPVSGIN
jgi:hypothetical protein